MTSASLARGRPLLAPLALLLLTVLLAVPATAYPERAGPDREFPASGGGDFVVADLTGDGWTDLVAFDDETSRLWVYEGSDRGLSPDPWAAITAPGVLDLAVADLDGDGGMELIAVDGERVFWSGPNWNGNGTGSAGLEAVGGRAVAVGDLDADGRLDLAVIVDAGVRVWFQRADGFATATLPFSNDPFDGVAVGDLNGDGRDDVALAASLEVRVHLQGSQGMEPEPVRLPVKYSGGDVSVGLVDADGDIPLLAVATAADAAEDGGVVLWRWGDGTFDAVATLWGRYAARFAFGDSNGDRRSDLALLRLDGSVAVFYQRGAAFTLEVPDLVLEGPVQGEDGRLAIADVNGDGFEDIVVRYRNPNVFFAYLQEDALPALIRPIPSTYAVNRGTVEKGVVDLRQFFVDDHNRLTFAIAYQSDVDHVKAAVDGGALDLDVTPDWFGTVDFRVSAWDGNPNHAPVESNEFTILVNDPPQIASAPPMRAVTGEGYRYAVSVRDAYPEDDVHTFALLAGPDGMAIDAATGLLTWAPTAAHAGSNAVSVEVRDGYGGAAVQTFGIVVGPAGAGSPVTLVVVGVVASTAALLAAAALINENAKFAFLLFVLPLYTKIKRERVLDHFVRGQIYGYVQANPGEHYNAIKKALGLTNGSLAHHLRTLERERFIKSKRFGLYRRFYPMAMQLPEDGAFQPNEVQRMILDVIRDRPGITQKALAERLGLTPPTVNYHVSLLSERNLIRVVRRGRSTHCSLVEQTST